VVGFGIAGGLVGWGFGEARAKDGRVGAGVMLPAINAVPRAGSLHRIRMPMPEGHALGKRE
jgi:hypothetical protein